jgi:hypothetical protein
MDKNIEQNQESKITVKKQQKTLNFRKYFLTIPKCNMSKEEIKILLVENEKFLSQYMIGQEKHVDGSNHYHIYLKYSRQKDYGYGHFDYLGQHGKLEGCRSPRRSFIYIAKEDKEPLANFDYEGGILSGKPEEIAMYLGQTGKRYDDLFKGNNNSVHLLATKWRSVKNWESEFEQRKKLVEINERKKGIRHIDKNLMKKQLTRKEYQMMIHDSGLQTIVDHVNNMMQYKWNRPFKTKSLLIWSNKPGVGKTSLIRKLMEYCPMYGFPRDQWFHGYKSNTFWGILWNEMTLTGVDVEMLKNFLEGTSVTLDIKGSKVEKEDNPEVFMTANFNLTDMIEDKYRNLLDSKRGEITLAALKERIHEVCVDNYENIFFLSKLIIPLE